MIDRSILLNRNKILLVVTHTDIVFIISQLVLFSFNLLHFTTVVDSDISDKSPDEDHQQQALEELTNLQFKFEVKEVCR